MTALTNPFEGIATGTTITSGSGGNTTGGSFLDAVTVSGSGTTATFSTVHAAHGVASANLHYAAVSSTGYLSWTTSMGSQPQVWFRLVLFHTANPSANVRLWQADQAGTTLCGAVYLNSTGTLQFVNSAAATIFTTTNTVPLGQWYRIEGMFIGSATVGQEQLSLYSAPDNESPLESLISAANLNTAGSPDSYRFGSFSATALSPAWDLWVDDIGLSNTAPLGPPLPQWYRPMAPGPTWKRHFRHHRQTLIPPDLTQGVVIVPATAAIAGTGVAGAIPTLAADVLTDAVPGTGAAVAVPTISVSANIAGAGAVGGAAALATKLLTNSYEGGTNGSAITAGGSGGASGNAFDAINISGTGTTLTWDNTLAAHGTLAGKYHFATVSSGAYESWTTSMGSQAQVWFRRYLYHTAYPTVALRIWQADIGGSTLCAALYLMPDGTLLFADSVANNILQTADSVPLSQWYRIEGFHIGSATVGQLELKLFLNKDAPLASPDQTLTSFATTNTGGIPDSFRYGCFSGTTETVAFDLWHDDDGLSATGYLGPVGVQAAANIGGAGNLVAITSGAGAQMNITAPVAAGAGAATATATVTRGALRTLLWYPGYEQATVPPANIDYTAWTHITHLGFNPAPAGDGTIILSDMVSTANPPAAISAAHAAGLKIVVSIGEATEGSYFAASVASHLSLFITNIVATCTTYGYDGVEIDWEENVTTAAYISLISGLKTALNAVSPQLLLRIDVDSGQHGPAVVAGCLPYVDEVNVMAYSTDGHAMMQFYTSNGIPACQLALGVGFSSIYHDLTQLDVAQKVNYAYSNGFAGVCAWQVGDLSTAITDPRLAPMRAGKLNTTFPSSIVPGAGVAGALPIISVTGSAIGAGVAGGNAATSVSATAAIAGAGVAIAVPTIGAAGTAQGAGNGIAVPTIGALGTATGHGAALTVPTIGAPAAIAGAGVTGNVPTIGGGSGTSGSGTAGTVVPDLLVGSGTQGAGAATAGTPLVAWMPPGTAQGAGAAGARPTIGVLPGTSGAGAAGAVPAFSLSAAIAGTGTAGAVPTIGASSGTSGQGVAGAVPTIGVTSSLTGSGSAGGNAGGTSGAISGTGSDTATPTIGVGSGTQGVGSAGAVPTIGVLAAVAGAAMAIGTTPAIINLATGTATGAGVAIAQPTVGALGTAQGTGAAVTVPTIGVSAAIAGAGVAGAASITGGAGTAQGAGGAGAVPTIGVLAAVQGAGIAGGLAGTGVFAGASIAGAGVAGALPIISVTATAAGAGAAGGTAIVTVFTSAAIAGAGVAGAQPTVGVTGAATGSGTATGTTSVSFIFVQATGALTGAGQVTERPVLAVVTGVAGAGQLALLAQWQAAAALAAAGVATATATSHAAAIPATGSATLTDPREGTAARAVDLNTGASTLADPRDGSMSAASDPREGTAGISDPRQGVAAAAH